MQINQKNLQPLNKQLNIPDYKKENFIETSTSKSSSIEFGKDNMKTALDSFNKIFKKTHLEFQIHDEAGRYFVQIIDNNTQEVIRQIPSEEFLKMVAETKENLGLLIDIKI